ncbi:conserved hypothetical protein [Neospora caninum Liverpool]|uniref:Uncharacterized protein n=1 Tax=Neospora caninum (strain Liverpool) TaxID=572307 RepID=F0VBE8_NEOCL|nr:conserved hypothetical protein [Neospora caninum Liverpool]CBZ50932.1 conserved hypothetical protein [Neospora caninum Liverpool]CEL68233.1 TPA: hypothetical protein BN1204_040070 [Neospora caninum Liverpool]|eukprot:XP_003880965.1 conserved hypothetical protein [Neospora caninum Liverpool]
MDAVMVVHQLQRLAATVDPSPAVAAKLPRVAVGICYFIEHPEVGVRQQAANAVKKVVSLHGNVLHGTKEGSELEAMLARYVDASTDPVVVESCREALEIFQGTAPQDGAACTGEEKSQTADQPAEEDLHSAASASSPVAVPRKDATEAEKETGAGDASAEKENSSLGDKSPGRVGSASRLCSPSDSCAPLEGEMYTVLLGLRGLAADLQRKREKGAPPSPAASVPALLRGALEELQRELQYRLVCIPGVSSATITLNIRGLCAQLDAAGDHVERRGEEGDGVAVLLVRLSQDTRKRMRHLQHIKDAAGPLTLVLRAERVYDGSRVKSRGNQEGPDRETVSERRTDEANSPDSPSAAPAYLDEETTRRESKEEQDTNGAADGTASEHMGGEGLHGAGETAAGYSFFSRNSVLFTQSRFLGSSILPYEDDPELASRLKREKEKKAAERLKQLESQTVLDRVLGNIGKVRFW